jgi:hypothetical protein
MRGLSGHAFFYGFKSLAGKLGLSNTSPPLRLPELAAGL